MGKEFVPIVGAVYDRPDSAIRYRGAVIDRPYSSLIRSGENHAAPGRGPAFDTLSIFSFRTRGNIANRSFGFVFDALFAFTRTAPVRPQESAFPIQHLVELRVIVNPMAVLLAKLARAFVHRTLDGFKHPANGLFQAILRRWRLLPVIAAREHDLIFLQILRPDFDSKRNPSFLPFVEFPSGAVLITIVDLESDACGFEWRRELLHSLHDPLPLFGLSEDRHHRYLYCGKPG